MGARSNVVISFEDEGRGDKVLVLEQLLELRKWCYTNIKDEWRSYELTHGGGKIKYFFVFEFSSKKDEMLFRLYTGT